jgi:cytochrome o ubiquinol oxidase operon protein cyoD
VSEQNDRKSDKPRSKILVYGVVLAFAGAAFATLYYLARGAPQKAGPGGGKAAEVRSYAIGYGLALVLTGAAFASVRWQVLTGATTFAVVLVLALLQTLAHFRFFLHITLKKSARDDLQLILFSALIVLLMVSGTLVVLFNLRSRMM